MSSMHVYIYIYLNDKILKGVDNGLLKWSYLNLLMVSRKFLKEMQTFPILASLIVCRIRDI